MPRQLPSPSLLPSTPSGRPSYSPATPWSVGATLSRPRWARSQFLRLGRRDSQLFPQALQENLFQPMKGSFVCLDFILVWFELIWLIVCFKGVGRILREFFFSSAGEVAQWAGTFAVLYKWEELSSNTRYLCTAGRHGGVQCAPVTLVLVGRGWDRWLVV